MLPYLCVNDKRIINDRLIQHDLAIFIIMLLFHTDKYEGKCIKVTVPHVILRKF